MSDFDDQFNELAMPLLAERQGDALVMLRGPTNFTGIVNRQSMSAAQQPVSNRSGRSANEMVQIQVCTAGVFPVTDDQITLPDGSVATMTRQIAADPDGQYPLVECVLPHGITSKASRARP